MHRLLSAEAIRLDEDGQASLIGSRCRACGQETVPPAAACPVCAAEDLEIREQPREGELYSYTVLHVGAGKWRKPLRVGYVDLPNGVRVFAHLTGGDMAIGETLSVGTAVVGCDADGVELTALAFHRKGNAR